MGPEGKDDVTATETQESSPGVETNRIPENAALPVRSETPQVGQLGCAIFFFLAALVAVGFGMYRAMVLGDMSGVVFMLVCSIIGLLLAVAGYAIKVYEESYEFTPEHVKRRWRTLLGKKEWIEPYSNYQGVLMYEEYHSGGENRSSYTEHIVKLKHSSEESKDVELYNSRQHEGFRAQTERYCRLFSLPALRQHEDGTLEERAVEDLDKSVRDLVAEGRMEVTFDPTRPPPGEVLKLSIEGQGLRISALGNSFVRFRRVAIILTLVTGLGMAMAGSFITALPTPARIMLVLLGVVDVVVGQALAYVSRKVGQELYVSPSEVASWWLLPWGKMGQSSVFAARVEDVTVRTPPESHGFTAVVAETDDDCVVFGIGLKDVEKRWLRDAIIAVISKDAGQAAAEEPPVSPE